MIHELNVSTEDFKAVASGKKSFEIWSKDKPYTEGDLLALNEYDGEIHTGNSCLVYVDYVMTLCDWHNEDYAVMSIKPCTVYKHTEPFDPYKLTKDYSVPLATQEGDTDV